MIDFVRWIIPGLAVMTGLVVIVATFVFYLVVAILVFRFWSVQRKEKRASQREAWVIHEGHPPTLRVWEDR